jgi:hypothetical protein
LYSTEQHGCSLRTLYRRIEQRGGTVVSKINAELDKALAEVERLKEELDEAWNDLAAARKALSNA